MSKRIIPDIRVYNFFMKNPNMTLKEIGAYFDLSLMAVSNKITKVLAEKMDRKLK